MADSFFTISYHEKNVALGTALEVGGVLDVYGDEWVLWI